MSFTLPPAGSHYISLSTAKDMTARYRQNLATILNADYVDKEILINAETFNIEDFQSFFTNPNNKGIRIYYGMSSDLKVHAILVGVDADGNDILPASDADDVKILEEGKRCPPYCPPTIL